MLHLSSLRSVSVFTPCLVAVVVATACASKLPEGDDDDVGSGGTSTAGRGGAMGAGHGGSGGTQGGSTATGGTAGSGTPGTGGVTGGGSGGGGGLGTTGGTGGTAGIGGGASGTGGVAGSIGSGGTAGSGGRMSAGGAAGSGGRIGAGGAGSGGVSGSAGKGGSGGVSGSAGKGGSGGAAIGGSSGSGSGGSGGATVLDCSAPMPTGGTDHCGQNTQGKAGDLTWSLWSNSLSSSACITTFSTPAFSARFSNNNDFLARIGVEYGNNGKPYSEYGTIKADFSYKKNGSGGGYSYIGAYGWTTNPCVEWYIVDDRWGSMPFNAYNAAEKGSATMDGASYKIFQNKTNGTGGSRCSGVSQWDQFWSIRQSARQCGTITISDHFKAWDAAGLKLGNLLEAKILVETGGGTGDIEFPIANVTASQ